MNNFFPALGHVEMPPLWPPANVARYAKRSQGGKVPKKKNSNWTGGVFHVKN